MLTGFWHAVSFLGSAGFYVPVLLVLFWCAAPRVAARAAVLLLIGGYVNTVLKFVFHDPRPYWTNPRSRASRRIRRSACPRAIRRTPWWAGASPPP